MKNQGSQPDVAALGIVVDALDRLDDRQKQWVLQTAASRFSLPLPLQTPGVGTGGAETGTPSTFGSAQYKGIGEPTPKSFMKERSPKSDVQRITCLAYYLTKFRGTPHFKTKDLSELNTAAAQPKFSNASVAVDNATKAKFLSLAGKGNKQITVAGEDLVEALPDQDNVKALHSPGSRKKKTTKKKCMPE
jgi:hypothetical protein